MKNISMLSILCLFLVIVGHHVVISRAWNQWSYRGTEHVLHPDVAYMRIYGTPASWYYDDEYDGGIRQDLDDI